MISHATTLLLTLLLLYHLITDLYTSYEIHDVVCHAMQFNTVSSEGCECYVMIGVLWLTSMWREWIPRLNTSHGPLSRMLKIIRNLPVVITLIKAHLLKLNLLQHFHVRRAGQSDSHSYTRRYCCAAKLPIETKSLTEVDSDWKVGDFEQIWLCNYRTDRWSRLGGWNPVIRRE